MDNITKFTASEMAMSARLNLSPAYIASKTRPPLPEIVITGVGEESPFYTVVPVNVTNAASLLISPEFGRGIEDEALYVAIEMVSRQKELRGLVTISAMVEYVKAHAANPEEAVMALKALRDRDDALPPLYADTADRIGLTEKGKLKVSFVSLINYFRVTRPSIASMVEYVEARATDSAGGTPAAPADLAAPAAAKQDQQRVLSTTIHPAIEYIVEHAGEGAFGLLKRYAEEEGYVLAHPYANFAQMMGLMGNGELDATLRQMLQQYFKAN